MLHSCWHLVVVVLVLVTEALAGVRLERLCPCGFLNGGYITEHPSASRTFCYFPLPRLLTNKIYRKKNTEDIQIAYPSIVKNSPFVGYDDHARACALFDAHLFSAESFSEINFIYGADFLEPGASFITKYRFDKDGKFVISVTSDIQYISALLKEELGSYRHCGEQDSSECCIALKFEKKRTKVSLASCKNFSSYTVICKKPAEHLPFDEKPTPYNALKSVTTPILEFINATFTPGVMDSSDQLDAVIYGADLQKFLQEYSAASLLGLLVVLFFTIACCSRKPKKVSHTQKNRPNNNKNENTSKKIPKKGKQPDSTDTKSVSTSNQKA